MKNILNILNLNLFIKYKYFLYFFIIAIPLAFLSIFFYPKTELIVAVSKKTMEKLDENGKVRKEEQENIYYTLQEKLEKQGIKLIFKAEDKVEHAKPLLKFLVDDPAIDFTISKNWGGKLSVEESKKALSLGAIRCSPFYFIVKKNNKDIRLIKDLKGKKIAFWSSPEGKKNPVFTKGGDKATEYSSDILLENIFKIAGVTEENSQLINYWPNNISANDDWDIFISSSIPLKHDLKKYKQDFYNALLDREIKFLELEDIEGLSKNLPQTKLIQVPKSLFEPENNFPSQSFKTLGLTTSVFINKNLDPSHILILSEVLKEMFDKPGKFSQKNEYPNFSATEIFEPSTVAEKFYKEGENSFLKSYFPPVFSAFLAKLLFVLAPIFFIIIPLTTISPAILKKYFQMKINKYYEEIYSIEKSLEDSTISDHKFIKLRLDRLDDQVRSDQFSLVHDDFVQQIFIVREHIAMIHKKIARMNLK
jgi:hypothetical protein